MTEFGNEHWEHYEVPRDTWNARFYSDGRRAGKSQRMAEGFWEKVELNEVMAELAALEQTIMAGSRLSPVAVMLPLGYEHSLAGGVLMGNDIILGDRRALIYEPVTRFH